MQRRVWRVNGHWADAQRVSPLGSGLLKETEQCHVQSCDSRNQRHRARQALASATLKVLGAGEPIRDEAKSGHKRLFYRHTARPLRQRAHDDEPATSANGSTIG